MLQGSVPDGTALANVADEVAKIAAVIVLGYLARSTGFVTADAASGIGQLAGKVCLPALIFKLVATADFGTVDWRIVGCMQFCQMATSLGAASTAVLLREPLLRLPRLSLAGAFALFVANVDYTAVGVPLISSLCPSQLLYVYIFLLINICVFAPVAFFCMELGGDGSAEPKGDSEGRTAFGLVVKKSLLRVLTNPLVVAGLVGIIWNAVTHGCHLPQIMGETMDGLGSAFRTCALFNLGTGMVGQIATSNMQNVAVPLVLVMWKSLALPACARALTGWLVSREAADFVFVCGIVGSAASTPLIISMFLPKLVDIMRFSTVMNLILSMPVFMLSAVIYSGSEEHTEALLAWGRDLSHIASAVGIVALLFGFAGVPRWRRYPMLLMLDLLLLGLLFHLTQYICAAEPGMRSWMFTVSSVFRLAWRGYMLSLSVVLLALRRWGTWFPDVPLGYHAAAVASKAEDGPRSCPWHVQMRRLHNWARCASLAYGLAGTLAFVGMPPQKLESLGCWIQYGKTQWVEELVVGTAIMLAQFTALVLYSRLRTSKKRSQPVDASMGGVKFRMAFFLWVQAANLFFTFILELIVVAGFSENYVGSPAAHVLLMVLILIQDGSGFLQFLLFHGASGAKDVLQLLQVRMQIATLGATPERHLWCLVARMAIDPDLRPCLVVAPCEDGMARQGSRRRLGFRNLAMRNWLGEHGACSDEPAAEAVLGEMIDRGFLRRGTVCASGDGAESYCQINLAGTSLSSGLGSDSMSEDSQDTVEDATDDFDVVEDSEMCSMDTSSHDTV